MQFLKGTQVCGHSQMSLVKKKTNPEINLNCLVGAIVSSWKMEYLIVKCNFCENYAFPLNGVQKILKSIPTCLGVRALQ